eukprot:s5758_g5.t3
MEAEPSRQMPTEAATGSERQTAEAENGRPTWPDIARIFEVDCPRHLIPQSTKQLSTLAARKRPVADNTPYEDSGGSGRALDTDAAGKSLESICCLPAADVFLSSSNFSCLDRGSSKRSQETCRCRASEVKRCSEIRASQDTVTPPRILCGVDSINGRRRITSTLVEGAKVLAKWSDGQPLVVQHPDKNVFSISQRVSRIFELDDDLGHDDTLQLVLNVMVQAGKQAKRVRGLRRLSSANKPGQADSLLTGGVNAIVETWIAARADFFVGTIESRFTMSIQLERSFLGKPHRTSEQEFCKEYKRGKSCLAPSYRHTPRHPAGGVMWLFPFGLCRRRCTVACAHRWRWLRSQPESLQRITSCLLQLYSNFVESFSPQDADERPGGVSDVPSWQIPELVVECPKRPGARIHKGTSLILPEAGGDLLACVVSSLPVLLQIRPRWILGYSMAVDGVSLRTMYRQLADSGPCVMIVEDSSNCIFGAFLSEGLRRRGSTLRATETAESLECLNRLAKESDQSWLDQLSPDPETDLHVPNTDPREVKSGHYVEVWPTPLPDPKLVIYSQEVADMLGIPEDEVRSDSFTAFFSGQRREIPIPLRSWCTPYALAIMGQRMVSNCPFGNGNGYGDGRAISVGELLAHGQRFELQLKGAGRTPFCRGGDGRAVLRSSIREFLASEAMHHLGDTDMARWLSSTHHTEIYPVHLYHSRSHGALRLVQLKQDWICMLQLFLVCGGVETTRALSLVVSGSETVRRPWYADNGSLYSSREPNTMVNEPCAITTRVAPSFLRVGHVDLFARRAAASPGGSAATELEQIVEHALFREYPDIAQRAEPLPERAVAMLEAFADRLAALVSGWLRVGFCQGNFNSDNCLVGGRTMDYGPFGFIDRYDPLFAKWTGSGEHYGFLNQPQAAMANYHTLAVGRQMRYANIRIAILSSRHVLVLRCSEDSGAEDQLGHLDRAFYEPPNDELRQEWDAWLQKWAATVLSEGEGGEGARQQVASRLSAVNPKYVPREWMLVEAYTKAEKEGDYTVVQELYELFKRPYDEQPAYERYYSRGPDDVVSRGPHEQLGLGGLRCMAARFKSPPRRKQTKPSRTQRRPSHLRCRKISLRLLPDSAERKPTTSRRSGPVHLRCANLRFQHPMHPCSAVTWASWLALMAQPCSSTRTSFGEFPGPPQDSARPASAQLALISWSETWRFGIGLPDVCKEKTKRCDPDRAFDHPWISWHIAVGGEENLRQVDTNGFASCSSPPVLSLDALP